MEDLIAKAAVLIEALPYIQRFRSAVVVIKLGGSAMEEKAHYQSILGDVAFMECAGMLPVLVHGGGKAISRAMSASGRTATFVKGLRVTDADTIRLVEHVLRDEVNPALVAELQAHGAQAQRIDGTRVFQVTRRVGRDETTGATLDWGYVGDIQAVDPAPLQACLDANIIPVVTPLGKDAEGQTYNLNADDAAAAAAESLKARKLVYLSDVPGLLRDRQDASSILASLRIQEVEALIRTKVIDGGMLPKIRSCVTALQAGVKKIHIVDGRMAHSLLLEIFTDNGVGTEIIE